MKQLLALALFLFIGNSVAAQYSVNVRAFTSYYPTLDLPSNIIEYNQRMEGIGIGVTKKFKKNMLLDFGFLYNEIRERTLFEHKSSPQMAYTRTQWLEASFSIGVHWPNIKMLIGLDGHCNVRTLGYSSLSVSRYGHSLYHEKLWNYVGVRGELYPKVGLLKNEQLDVGALIMYTTGVFWHEGLYVGAIGRVNFEL